MGFDTPFDFGEMFSCTAGPLPSVLPGLCISGTTSSTLLAGGPAGPFELSLVLTPAPGFNVTYGPNRGIFGTCVKALTKAAPRKHEEERREIREDPAAHSFLASSS